MTFVVVALASTALFGMAAITLDVGILLNEKARLQNATDAAVLAAAAFLPSTDAGVLNQAEDAAVQYSTLNGYPITVGDVNISTTGATNDTVQITTSVTRGLFFAPILGIVDASPGATAAAQIGAVAGGAGVMPFGIEDQPFTHGQSYCLKLGTNSCGQPVQGNFHALDIDDVGNASANEYRDKIVNGSSSTIRIGDVKNIAPGNMAGPTRLGVGCQGNSGRLSGSTQVFTDVVQDNGDGTYTILDWQSPHLVLVPIVIFDGNTSAEVTGFAAFYLEGCVGNDAISGIFIQVVWPDSEWGELNGMNDNGAHSVRLVF